MLYKHRLLFIFFHFSAMVFAQKNPLRFFDQWGPGVQNTGLIEIGDSIGGRREGKWFMYYGDNLLGMGLYKNGMRDSTWTYYRPLKDKRGLESPSRLSVRQLKKYEVDERIGYRLNFADGYCYRYNAMGAPWTAFQMVQDSLVGTGYEYDTFDLVRREWKFDSLLNRSPYFRVYERAKIEGSRRTQLEFMKNNYSVYGCYSDTTGDFPVWDLKLKKIVYSAQYGGESFKDISENSAPPNAEGDHRQYKDGTLWEVYVVFHGIRKYSVRKGLPVKK
jgi:hypothetical protein